MRPRPLSTVTFHASGDPDPARDELRRSRRAALEGVRPNSWRWQWVLARMADERYRPDAHGRQISRALALAFLSAAQWRRPDLVRAAGTVLGVRRQWLYRLVDDVLTGYPHPPTDRPRELAAAVAGNVTFRAALRSAAMGKRRDQVRVWLATPTRMVRRPFHTTAIDDVGALAAWLALTDSDLEWYADRSDINRHATDRRLRHYRYLWLNGRLIEAPKDRLRAIQRQLLREVIGPIPTHPAVHGFVTGRSPHTFAAPHAGRPVVIRLDITSFFAAVTAPRIYGLLRTAGYPEPVAHTVTGLCTTRTPAPVLTAVDRDVPERAYRLALLRAAHLPQGAPTSPALANLCGFRLDRRLCGLAARFGAVYTRYADDLAFSGDLTPRGSTVLVAAVTAIAADEGFRVNARKTRIRGRADRQYLAGLVVNERPAVPRTEYDAMRALLHNATRTGLAEQNRDGHPDFDGFLRGRIAWIGYHHPTRAARLLAMLAATSGDAQPEAVRLPRRAASGDS